jgi:hypothetical protein
MVCAVPVETYELPIFFARMIILETAKTRKTRPTPIKNPYQKLLESISYLEVFIEG